MFFYLRFCPVRPGQGAPGLHQHAVHGGPGYFWEAVMNLPSEKSELLRDDWPPAFAYHAGAPTMEEIQIH